MICKNCGVDNEEYAGFCRECGAKIEKIKGARDMFNAKTVSAGDDAGSDNIGSDGVVSDDVANDEAADVVSHESSGGINVSRRNTNNRAASGYDKSALLLLVSPAITLCCIIFGIIGKNFDLSIDSILYAIIQGFIYAGLAVAVYKCSARFTAVWCLLYIAPVVLILLAVSSLRELKWNEIWKYVGAEAAAMVCSLLICSLLVYILIKLLGEKSKNERIPVMFSACIAVVLSSLISRILTIWFYKLTFDSDYSYYRNPSVLKIIGEYIIDYKYILIIAMAVSILGVEIFLRKAGNVRNLPEKSEWKKYGYLLTVAPVVVISLVLAGASYIGTWMLSFCMLHACHAILMRKCDKRFLPVGLLYTMIIMPVQLFISSYILVFVSDYYGSGNEKWRYLGSEIKYWWDKQIFLLLIIAVGIAESTACVINELIKRKLKNESLSIAIVACVKSIGFILICPLVYLMIINSNMQLGNVGMGFLFKYSGVIIYFMIPIMVLNFFVVYLFNRSESGAKIEKRKSARDMFNADAVSVGNDAGSDEVVSDGIVSDDVANDEPAGSINVGRKKSGSKQNRSLLIAASVVIILLALGGAVYKLVVDSRMQESLSTLTVGQRNVKFGKYTWRVLDVKDGKALLLSEDVIETRAYNDNPTSVTWEKCDLRKYLNGEFKKNFSSAEQKRIAEVVNKNPDNQWYGTSGGNDTKDSIFLLSIEEVVKYFGDSGNLKNGSKDDYYISDKYDEARIAKYNGQARWWWLRSPGSNGSLAARVDSGGYVLLNGHYVRREDGGLRPALWINQ